MHIIAHFTLLTILSRCGRFTAPVALLVLLLVVLFAGPTKKELIPWIPLFFTSSSLITVALHEFSRHFRIRWRPQFLEDGTLNVIADTWSDPSYRARLICDNVGCRPPSESLRHDPIFFERHGPSSDCTRRTGDSDIALTDVEGRCRSDWDPRALSFFALENPRQDTRPAGQTDASYPRDHDSQERLSLEAQSVESDQPLLGPQWIDRIMG